MPKKITLDEIKERLLGINSNIEILSNKYINAKNKLLCKCKIDGNEWEVTWGHLSTGGGCPMCGNKKAGNYCKLNLEKINKMLETINPNIRILDERYINNSTKLKCKCLIDGNVWLANWNNLSNNKGCPECKGREVKERCSYSIQEIKAKLKKVNPDIEILSKEYTNSLTKLKLKCKIDGFIWEATGANLLNAKGCPQCYHERKCGDTNYSWKGGITPLINYTRTHILQWKKDSMQSCGYKCAITGEKFDVIHHLYSFNQIFQETMDTLKLPINREVSLYSDNELNDIIKLCVELHYKYGLGICLTSGIHKEFHKIYGMGNNNPQQFEEFKK